MFNLLDVNLQQNQKNITKLNDGERKKLIEETEARVRNEIEKKNGKFIIFFNKIKITIVNDPPPKYE